MCSPHLKLPPGYSFRLSGQTKRLDIFTLPSVRVPLFKVDGDRATFSIDSQVVTKNQETGASEYLFEGFVVV